MFTFHVNVSFCGCINCPLHNMHLQNVNIWPHDLRPLLHLLLQQIQPFCGQCTWGFGATKMPKRDFLNNALFIDVFHDQNMLKEKLNDQFNRILFIFKMSLIQLRSWILILWHNNQIVVSKKYAIIKLDHHLPGLKIPPKKYGWTRFTHHLDSLSFPSQRDWCQCKAPWWYGAPPVTGLPYHLTGPGFATKIPLKGYRLLVALGYPPKKSLWLGGKTQPPPPILLVQYGRSVMSCDFFGWFLFVISSRRFPRPGVACHISALPDPSTQQSRQRNGRLPQAAKT